MPKVPSAWDSFFSFSLSCCHIRSYRFYLPVFSLLKNVAVDCCWINQNTFFRHFSTQNSNAKQKTRKRFSDDGVVKRQKPKAKKVNLWCSIRRSNWVCCTSCKFANLVGMTTKRAIKLIFSRRHHLRSDAASNKNPINYDNNNKFWVFLFATVFIRCYEQ